MSDFIEKIHPISGKHSIKEATISLFLVNQIIKPERFQKLIETSYKGNFQQFAEVEQLQVEIQNKNAESTVNTNTRKNIGFRFFGFNDKGKTTKVFQGINEDERKFISFHCLDYLTWQNFYDDFIDTVKKLSLEHNELFAHSFSLQYVDVFNWSGIITDFQAALFFNEKSQTLPLKFFSSKFSRTYLLTIEEEFEGLKFFDRIEVRLENKLIPEITISHNIAHQLDTEQDLATLINTEQFIKMLKIAHKRNKEILGDILTVEIKNRINL